MTINLRSIGLAVLALLMFGVGFPRIEAGAKDSDNAGIGEGEVLDLSAATTERRNMGLRHDADHIIRVWNEHKTAGNTSERWGVVLSPEEDALLLRVNTVANKVVAPLQDQFGSSDPGFAGAYVDWAPGKPQVDAVFLTAGDAASMRDMILLELRQRAVPLEVIDELKVVTVNRTIGELKGLQSIAERLLSDPEFVGEISTDLITNQIVVEASQENSDLPSLLQVAEIDGISVEFSRTPEELVAQPVDHRAGQCPQESNCSPYRAGQEIYLTGALTNGKCTAGWVFKESNTQYWGATSAHCILGRVSGPTTVSYTGTYDPSLVQVYQNLVGQASNDIELESPDAKIRYTFTDDIYLYSITSSNAVAKHLGTAAATRNTHGRQSPVVNSVPCHNGATEHRHCGKITNLTSVANTSSGWKNFKGFKYNALSLGGDSGGPIYTQIIGGKWVAVGFITQSNMNNRTYGYSITKVINRWPELEIVFTL